MKIIKEHNYSIALLLVFSGMFFLTFDNMFYPGKITDTYERCENICIRDNNTFPCDCKEIIEKESTSPLWYGILFFVLMILGLILMFKEIFKMSRERLK